MCVGGVKATEEESGDPNNYTMKISMPLNTLVSNVINSQYKSAHWGSSPLPGGKRSHLCAWLQHTGKKKTEVHKCVKVIKVRFSTRLAGDCVAY